MRILLLILLLTLAACTDTNRPAEADIKARLESLSHLCPQCYTLKIEDTSGADKDNFYIVHFKAVIEMRKHAYLMKDDSLPASAGMDIQDIRADRSSDKDISIPAGTRYSYSGAVYFLKNEKGWRKEGVVAGRLTK
jgi:hypothetical protein